MATAAILPLPSTSSQWISSSWSMMNTAAAGDADAAVTAIMDTSSSSSSIHHQDDMKSRSRSSHGGTSNSNQAAMYTYSSGYPHQTTTTTTTAMPSSPVAASQAAIQPPLAPSLFSQSELQAIDGFLDSFSAPSLPNVSVMNSNNGYIQQPLPFSSSTAFYRPEYENSGWRGGPTTTVGSTSAHAYNQPHQQYGGGRYTSSYHPTASFHRPSSPSSASASSSSYPKTTLAQAEQSAAAAAASSNGGIPLAGRPTRLSNSPFSSASHAAPEERPDDREKRLRSQANDLAGWLSRYNHPVPQQYQQQQYQHTHQQSAIQPNHNATRSYHDSSVYSQRPAQTSGPSSIGSTSNSESIPTPSSKVTPSHQPYTHSQYGNSNMSAGSINPYDTSLSGSKPPHMSRPPSLPQPQPTSTSEASNQVTTTAASTRKASTDSAVEKGKSKAAKHAGPAKKKTSSTTASVREKKKPIAKAPAKALKAAISPPSESNDPINESISPSNLPQTAPEPSPSSAAASNTANAAKGALSEEQKRANHIASEQKRRHAIRAAYDALCTVVPSLSAAVKEYEDRLSKLHPSLVQGGSVKNEAPDDSSMDVDASTSGIAPVQTVAGVLTGGIEVGGEKIDGRAGPRSEAVVLAKTVEYMRDLLDQREDSLARLQELYDQLQARGGKSTSANPLETSAPWNTKWSSKTR